MQIMSLAQGNPQALLQNLASSNPQMGQLINAIKSSSNPMAFLNQYAQSNPAMAQALKVAQGKTPQQIQTFIQNAYNQGVK